MNAEVFHPVTEDPVSNVLKWILLAVAIATFGLLGWPQLNAVYEHGLAYARSQEFYDTTIFWQWMRFPGDVVFALGALLMAWDLFVRSARIEGAGGVAEREKKKDDYQILGSTTPRHCVEAVSCAEKFWGSAVLAD